LAISSYFEGPRPIRIENADLPIDMAELLFWLNDFQEMGILRDLDWGPGTWLWSHKFIYSMMKASTLI
jgi:hypothetical protein